MAILEMKGVNKSFEEHQVIQNFSYTFDADKIYAIIGPSGAGKSTLLNIMGLLEKSDSGVINYFGKEGPTKLSSHNTMMMLRENIAYLFQNYALLENETVEDNIKIALEYSKTKNKREIIRNALSSVGLEGYENKKVHTLSGGEQQRVALARIMVKPCKLVLADEPTGNLDEKNKKEVFDILNKMRDDHKTIIIVTHDQTVVDKCDEVIELSKLEEVFKD